MVGSILPTVALWMKQKKHIRLVPATVSIAIGLLQHDRKVEIIYQKGG